MDQYIMQINRIIYTLNLVSVRGKENLDSLLASIQALENLKEKMLKEGERIASENK